jgi:hypothetical protein
MIAVSDVEASSRWQLKAPMVRATHRVGLKAEATVRQIAKNLDQGP